ncbi:O-antigen ligase family protein [Metapseudomonas boanensis]|uniref:O-antigen ligase family protein n=1 Tax=Metapseudomonas boanensis TaxID=2822138 RepID=A0ABS5XDN5_9GAMM|nr:O-antigen ligase family protein [Pseudomonas boanensis]MBT8765784.1 O-antigen ligase family protein [Pseudomonas boanensis]
MLRSTSHLERFLLAAMLLVLVWLPMPLGSNREWAVGLFILLMGGLGCAWAIGQFFDGAERGPQNKAMKTALPLLALLLLTQAWVAVQWLAGLTVDIGSTFQHLMLGLAYCLLFLLVIALFHTRKRLNLLLGTLVVSGTLQAFFGAFMTLSDVEWLLAGPKDSYIGDATGTFVNRNHLAGYLEMTLACGIGLLLALRDDSPFSWANLVELLMGPKARLRLALVVMVIALVMTHSRMGNIAFFASLLLVGSLFVVLEKENRLRNGLILTSIILIDVLVVSQYFGLERLKDRVLSTRLNDVVVNGEVVQQANEVRDDVFSYALPLLRERPLMGQGAGSFEAVFPRYPGEDIRIHFDHAHNDYIQFAVEFGLLGSLPLAAFILAALWYALRALWRRESVYRRGVGFGAAMGIVALLIHSSTDFNLQIPANAATLVVVCAIAVLAGSQVAPRKHAEHPGRDGSPHGHEHPLDAPRLPPQPAQP